MQLETPRLILREFMPDDWRAVLAYQNDPRYLAWYPGDSRSEADARAFVAMFLAQQAEQPRTKFQLAITTPEQGLIGNCGIRLDEPGGGVASLGYELAPEHWGYGYASEAARAMLRWGFGALGLHRLWARCLAHNSASANVLRKLGFSQEGRLREHELLDGAWRDTLLWGILAPEWRAQYPGEEK